MTAQQSREDAVAQGLAPGGHPMLILAIVLSATFMQLVDVSIVNVAIPSIQRDLHASYGSVQLVLVLYQLSFATTLITGARLGDIFGRRRLFLAGMVGFTLASMLCGAAPTPGVLVAARFVQGLASGLMFPQVLSVIQVTFAPAERGRAFGIFGATVGLATILGPLLGGALIQWNLFALDWRTIFYVNVPIGVLAVVAAVRVLGESRGPHASRLDLPGAAIVTVGLLLLVYPLTEGRELGWPWWSWAMLVAALPVLAGFAAYELRLTRSGRSPLVVMSLFRDRAFRVGLVLILVFMAGVPAFFFSFAIYLQLGLGFTALGSGLTSFAFAVGSGTTSALSDRLAKRWGRRVLVVGALTLTAGMALILLTVHLVGTHPHIYDFTVAFLIAGAGLGLFIAPVINIVLAGIHSDAAGSASGVLATGQQIGGALGVALFGVIFFGLVGNLASSSVGETVPQLRSALTAAHLPPAAADATVAGFRTCFVARANQNDPTALPASCRRAQQAATSLPVAEQRPVLAAVGANGSVTRQALGRTFSRAYERSLIYELAVFLLTALLVLALPRVDAGVLGRPSGASYPADGDAAGGRRSRAPAGRHRRVRASR